MHDYRGRKGQVFYASPLQPSVPTALSGVVTGLGRIMGYTPHRTNRPENLPLDVPKGGLTPGGLLDAYNAAPLAKEGHTGKGETIVFFEFDGFDQKDLDIFADTSGLPRFTPEVIGGLPTELHGETAMDLQVAHAIAPDARLVVVNARPTLEGDGAYEKIGRMFEEVDRQFPGAVWSLSIGWGCDALVNAADLAPVESALAKAQEHGTSAFDATGDNAGLECKGGDEWSSPPGPDHVGLDAISSLPTMTAVGATTLSTGPRGQWLAEYAWFDSPLSQGTSGGISALFERPKWQEKLSADRDTARRTAVARCRRGRRPVHRGEVHLRSAGVRRRWDVSGGADLGRADGTDEPVLEGQRRPGTGKHQSSSVPGGDRRRTAGLSGYSLGRQRCRPLATRLRCRDGTRKSEHLQPRPEPPQDSIAGGVRMTQPPAGDRGVATMSCGACDTEVPAAAFCGACGAQLSRAARRRAWPPSDGRVCGGARRAGGAPVGGEFTLPASSAPLPHRISSGPRGSLSVVDRPRPAAVAGADDRGHRAWPASDVSALPVRSRHPPRLDASFVGTDRIAWHRAGCRMGVRNRLIGLRLLRCVIG